MSFLTLVTSCHSVYGGAVEGDTGDFRLDVDFSAGGTIRAPVCYIPQNSIDGSVFIHVVVDENLTTCVMEIEQGTTGWVEDDEVAALIAANASVRILYEVQGTTGTILIKRLQYGYEATNAADTISLIGANDSGSTNLSAANTTYHLAAQGARGESSESAVQMYMGTPGDLESVAASTGTVGTSSTTTLTLRKNLASPVGGPVLSFADPATNTREIDSSNSVPFVAGDSFAYMAVNGAA